MKFKYNYVFFNTADRNIRKRNPNGYNTICAKDLENMENVNLVSYPLDWAPQIIRWLFYFTVKFNLPIKRLWYPFYFKNRFKDKKPLCFIASGTYLSPGYLRYLRRKYKDAKFIKIHRDLISLWEKRHPEFTNEVMEELFDIVMTYDEYEARKYFLPSFSEYESKIEVKKAENYPLCDVFFAGAAKNRLPILMDVYKRLTDAGLSVNYYLTGVPPKDRKPYPGIEYAQRNMPYSEMLYKTVNAKCVLEVNQENSVGYTSRFLEAVMYNKKLITNNLYIKNSKFYDEKLIKCFEKAEEIDTDFVKENTEINYNYKDEFSPVHLIEQIDKLL
ncbi:MAG: hypothetical protein J5590_02895 [Clostridia bacterium]|nr:hypothetical protein [Clostridia bacterium]